MAELKAGSKYYSGFHRNLKTFTESLSSQQATLLSELHVHVHAAMEASSSSGLPEPPCGRQVQSAGLCPRWSAVVVPDHHRKVADRHLPLPDQHFSARARPRGEAWLAPQ